MKWKLGMFIYVLRKILRALNFGVKISFYIIMFVFYHKMKVR